jgi:branched-chain amino acid aminotransferase
VIDERDRGFLLGDGVFETLLVVNRVAIWRGEHLTRMKKAARKLDLIFDQNKIEAEIDERLVTASAEALVMRVTLSRGVTARGLAADCETPNLLVTLEPFDRTLVGKPVRLAVSSIRRNPASVTDRHKTTSYANNIFAAREAKSKGADDALMLNQDGLVACTSIANVFVVKGKTLVTPPEQDGVLRGIVRQFLIEQAGSLGFSVEVKSMEKDDLEEAEGVFVTNSLRLLSPVTHLNGEDLPRADTARLMAAIQSEIQAQCGANLME